MSTFSGSVFLKYTTDFYSKNILAQFLSMPGI